MTGFVVDLNMGTGTVRQGAARIVTTGKTSALICTALLTEPFDDPSSALTNLQVFKAGKQNGD